MTEQQLEALEKLFPLGFCIVFREPNKNIRIRSAQGQNKDQIFNYAAEVLKLGFDKLKDNK